MGITNNRDNRICYWDNRITEFVIGITGITGITE